MHGILCRDADRCNVGARNDLREEPSYSLVIGIAQSDPTTERIRMTLQLKHIIGRAITIAAVAAAALTSTLVTSPDPANAHAQTNYGTPGKALVYGLNTGNITPTGWTTVRLDSGRFIVNRAPGFSGTQKITISWRIWKYVGGGWKHVGTGSDTWTAFAGQYVDWGGWSYAGDGGAYSTDSTITWKTSSGGFIAQGIYDYVHASDYRCAAAWPSCKITTHLGQAAIELAA